MTVVAETLQRALEHHQSGELSGAESLYREILRVDPQHADALHLLGVAAHQCKRHDAAVAYITQAIAADESSALYHSNLGTCYRALGRMEEAVRSFQTAVCLSPEFVGAQYNLGMALEARGSLDEAEAAYREAIRLDSDFVDAWNNLGNLYSSQKDFSRAIECFQRILELIPDFAGIHYNLGNALLGNGRLEEAIASYRKATELDPNLVEAHNNLGAALKDAGRFDEAAACFKKAIELNPHYTEAQYNLANVDRIRDDGEAAVEQLIEAVSRSPHNAELQTSLGKALEEAGRFEEAEENYREAINIEPRAFAAHFGLGYALLSQGKHDEARQSYERGLEINRCNASAWNNLGSIYNSNEGLPDALDCFKTSAAIEPENAKVHFNLGNVYKDLWRCEEAAAAYRRAIELDPTLADPHINLGVLLQNQGRLDDAVDSLSRAVRIDPDGSGGHFHRSLARLLKGDFAEGWEEYEWRWKYYDNDRGFRAPAWDGNVLGEKTLMIYGEQGVGDELMFASCLPDVIGRTAGCIVECDERLQPLFARSFPLAQVIGRGRDGECPDAAPLPHFDLQIAIGSLPRYVRSNLEAFPSIRRYLAPDPELRDKWNNRLAQLGDGLKVGLSWRGGHDPKIRRRRSTTLTRWDKLLSLAGVQFVNLQYGDCRDEMDAVEQQLGVTIHDWDDADPLKHLDDFAAQVAALDLVISTDNATVHMAGALGVRVWTLLPFAANWRWMVGRDDTPWYPTMTLIRQTAPDDWDDVFDRVAEKLATLADRGHVGRSVSAPPAVEIADKPALRLDPPNDEFSAGEVSTATQIPSILFDAESPEGEAADTPPALFWQSTAPHGTQAASNLPAAGQPQEIDPQVLREKQKYERMWTVDSYRRFSPGLAALEKFPLVEKFRQLGVKTILDAGCGSGKLMQKLLTDYTGEFEVRGFDISENCLDPFFDEIKGEILTIGCLWSPGDLTGDYDAVICTDVMEHIPTERVLQVLQNLRSATKICCFLAIALVPDNFGRSMLGEPLHLTVEKPQWWFQRLALAGFDVDSHAVEMNERSESFVLHVLATPK